MSLSGPPDLLAKWPLVGATSGLALATMLEYAEHSNQPKIYIVGRSDAKLAKVVGELNKANPNGTYLPIKTEISLLKNIDAACQEFQMKEKNLHLLLMCPGYLKLSRRGVSFNTSTSEPQITPPTPVH